MQQHEFQKILPIDIELEKVRTLYNYVIIEFDPKLHEKTNSGIFTPAITQVDTVALHVIRTGTVVKKPEKLYYSQQDSQYSMRWKTNIEIEIGDQVWLNPSTVNDYVFRENNKYYRVINYEDLIVAKRNDKIIMLNGFILLEPIINEIQALKFTSKVQENDKGKIKYIGKKNEEYCIPEYVQFDETVYRSDPDGIEEEDIVLFNKKDVPKLRNLEYDIYSKLDGKSYLIAQRYMIAAII